MSGLTIGFLGLGKIGRPMAQRLLEAGFDLAVYDLDAAAMESFAGQALLAHSAADLADRADVVIACLQTAAQYRQAILGADGVVHGKRAKAYIHLGTTGGACVRELADGLAASGMALLDAPVSGGVAGAARGQLVTMVAGPLQVFEFARPCLDAWSRKVVYLGARPGLAQTMKLVNNMLSAANLAVAAEVMVVGARAGIPAATMLDVINHGTGQNHATLTKLPDNIVTRRFDCGSTLHNVVKDLSAYAEEAASAGIESDVCQAVVRAFITAGEQSSLNDDLSTVVRPHERAAGVELRAA
ncbi:MAG: NAD(P)-dependent oxidoreductase [Polaromonas sp.]|nr:NAD(P)-dependent oxidoreductase [Polaromonas sp.]